MHHSNDVVVKRSGTADVNGSAAHSIRQAKMKTKGEMKVVDIS